MQGAPKGNTFAKGNSGGGRPSVKETVWHRDKWEVDEQVRKLEEKIATGVYAIRDVWLLKALKGNDAILKQAADKVLADLVDMTGDLIIATPLLHVLRHNNSDQTNSGDVQADQSDSGGDISGQDGGNG